MYYNKFKLSYTRKPQFKVFSFIGQKDSKKPNINLKKCNKMYYLVKLPFRSNQIISGIQISYFLKPRINTIICESL